MKQWTIEDVMTTEVITVLTDTPYGEIVAALALNGVSAVPVLDGFSHVAGVVSEADLLHKVEFSGDDDEKRIFEWGSRRTNRAKAHGDTAEQLMTSPAITVQPGVSIVAAAKRMEQEKIKRLPVVDELGRLVGIVSRRDLLTMYLRPDTEIRDDIIDGALRQLLWIDPLTVQVDVTDGVVTLTGEVDRRSTARIAAHVIRNVPGVIRVVDQMAFNYDDTAVAAATGM